MSPFLPGVAGHPRFKALELAARAHVPRQKIYEVLDSLVKKASLKWCRSGPNCFGGEPSLASRLFEPAARGVDQELADNGRAGAALTDDLKLLYSEGQGGAARWISCGS